MRRRASSFIFNLQTTYMPTKRSSSYIVHLPVSCYRTGSAPYTNALCPLTHQGCPLLEPILLLLRRRPPHRRVPMRIPPKQLDNVVVRLLKGQTPSICVRDVSADACTILIALARYGSASAPPSLELISSFTSCSIFSNSIRACS